jgi:Integrase core domain
MKVYADSVHRRRRHGLTRRDPAATPAPDLVGRQFTPPAPDRLWVADITQQRTDQGWLYLAVVLDCFSRRIVGWSMPSTCAPSWSWTPLIWPSASASLPLAWCITPITAASPPAWPSAGG